MSESHTFDDALERLCELGLSMSSAFVMLGQAIAAGWDSMDHPDGIGALQVDFDAGARDGKYFEITENRP